MEPAHQVLAIADPAGEDEDLAVFVGGTADAGGAIGAAACVSFDAVDCAIAEPASRSADEKENERATRQARVFIHWLSLRIVLLVLTAAATGLTHEAK